MGDETPKPPLLSRSQWRREGRSVKPKSIPRLTREYRKREINLYSLDQTYKNGPRAIAKNYLVDLFGNYAESFGYRPTNGEDICRVQSEWFKGGAGGFLERGFNYRLCKRGIQVGKGNWAESFHVPAGFNTRFAVVDLDNHLPTLPGTVVHLELVERIQDRLPDLIKSLGVKSTFWQYRSIEPTGIQLFLVFGTERSTKKLHDGIRKFLVSLGGDDLDKRLRDNGLATLADIEILPGRKLVSMPGCYGKLVFTDQELKIIDQRFDCEGLYRHVKEGRQAAGVLDRYRELVMVRNFGDEARPNKKSPAQNTRKSHRESQKDGYWSRLKNLCREGVTRPDCLHVSVLQPLAQALLFREFHDRPDKSDVCFRVLKDWLLRKHNGLVSRIGNGKRRSLEAQIKTTIKNTLRNPCPKALAYYGRMRLNDRKYPHRAESLLSLMGIEGESSRVFMIHCKGCFSEEGEETQASPERENGWEKQNTEEHTPPASLISYKGCISEGGNKNTGVSEEWRASLPGELIKRLEEYAGANLRRGKATARFLKFAAGFIREIGAEGSREINEKTLLGLAGREADADTSFLKEWKKHLVAAGILRTGWEDNIIRNVRGSKYRLAGWVVEDLNGKASPAPLQARRVAGGVNGHPGGEWPEKARG